MRSRKLPGFSLAEMLVALSIVVLLSLLTVFSLRSANQKDELRAAAAQLASDLRSAQAQALEAQNIKTCKPGTENVVCENSSAACGASACQDAIPSGYGIWMHAASSSYVIFADVNPATQDYKYTSANEKIQERELLLGTSDKVEIQSIETYWPSMGAGPAWANVSFVRQSGQAHIVDVLVPPQPEPYLILIRIRHKVSGEYKDVEVNKITGRVSVL